MLIVVPKEKCYLLIHGIGYCTLIIIIISITNYSLFYSLLLLYSLINKVGHYVYLLCFQTNGV